jgi:hypothetical protein
MALPLGPLFAALGFDFPTAIFSDGISIDQWEFEDDNQSFTLKGRAKAVKLEALRRILREVAGGTNKTDYIQFALPVFAKDSVFHRIRSCFLLGMPDISREIVSRDLVTLILFGAEGTGTGVCILSFMSGMPIRAVPNNDQVWAKKKQFHVDRAEAMNVALHVVGTNVGDGSKRARTKPSDHGKVVRERTCVCVGFVCVVIGHRET